MSKNPSAHGSFWQLETRDRENVLVDRKNVLVGQHYYDDDLT